MARIQSLSKLAVACVVLCAAAVSVQSIDTGEEVTLLFEHSHLPARLVESSSAADVVPAGKPAQGLCREHSSCLNISKLHVMKVNCKMRSSSLGLHLQLQADPVVAGTTAAVKVR
jgi:hypothetical protein